MAKKILVEPLDHIAGKPSRVAPQPALEQPPGARADHATCLLERDWLQSLARQNDIERIDEIGGGVDQRPVEIEDDEHGRGWLPMGRRQGKLERAVLDGSL